MTVTWKDDDAANHFLDQRRHMPQFGFMFDAALRFVRDAAVEPGHIVDLGCGSGVTGGAMRMAWPGARLTLLDNSPPMLKLARETYGGEPGVRVLEADLSEAGVIGRVVGGPVEVFVSSAAIHHLERPRQRALYAEVFEALAPGGVFVNIEHVASASPRTEAQCWDWFYDHVTRSRRADGEQVTVEQVRGEFEARQELNILTPVHEQVRWLSEIGFVDADCVVKSYEMAVFGGYKRQDA